MFFKFKKKKDSESQSSKIQLYVPDIDVYKVDEISRWRKPINSNANYIKAKRAYLRFVQRLNAFIFYLNTFLALLIFCAILIFIFAIDYERTVFYDGTNLYCVMEADDEVVKPYIPNKPLRKPF